MNQWPILASVTRIYHPTLNKTLYRDITYGDIKAHAHKFDLDIINDMDYDTIIVAAGTPCKRAKYNYLLDIDFIEILVAADTVNPLYDLKNHLHFPKHRNYVQFSTPIWTVH